MRSLGRIPVGAGVVWRGQLGRVIRVPTSQRIRGTLGLELPSGDCVLVDRAEVRYMARSYALAALWLEKEKPARVGHLAGFRQRRA